MADLDTTLQQREHKYGRYSGMADLHNKLIDSVREHKNYTKLPNEIKLSVEMILHKIARAINGDYSYTDNYTDIQGYAERALEYLNDKAVEKEQEKDNEILKEWSGEYFGGYFHSY